MFFFNWFLGKSPAAQNLAHAAPTGHGAAGGRHAVSLPQRQASEPVRPPEGYKVKRHARREELYVAVREAMTRAGVLSASYKFKVLSLDQPGNEFMVMLDLGKDFDGAPAHLSAIEALIVQTAKSRFEITVPAVYWRIDESAAIAVKSARHPVDALTRLDHHAPPLPQPKHHGAYEPIRDEEVAAFKQALLDAAKHGVPIEPVPDGKTRRTGRSYTLLTGFEDTEIVESASSPALSATQYGDLH